MSRVLEDAAALELRAELLELAETGLAVGVLGLALLLFLLAVIAVRLL